MVRIRLRRVGARKQPSYRIVAADKESPRDGKFLENLGHYNPRTEPSTVIIDEARFFHWMEHGAQPSDALVKVLKPLGTLDRWERYKGGEALEKLVAEAKAALPEVDPRTRRDDLIEKRETKKAAEKAAEKEEAPPKKAAKEKAKVKAKKTEVAVEEESPPETVTDEAPSPETVTDEAPPPETVTDEAPPPETVADEATPPETVADEAPPTEAKETDEVEVEEDKQETADEETAETDPAADD